MQYTDYISLYNARREREQQLCKNYNQQPAEHRIQNLWMHQVERSDHHKSDVKEMAGVVIGIIAAGFILLLSIWL